MKSQHNFTLIILFILLFTNCLVFIPIKAQSYKSEIELKYNSDNQKHYIKTIDFVNPINQKTINSFNLIKHSPYENLNYPELSEKNHQEYKAYFINNLELRDFKVKEGKFTYRKDIPDTTVIIDGFASSYSSIFYTDTSHIIVLYELYLYSDDVFLGISSKVIILSHEGEVLHQLRFFDTQCINPTITRNGRYFAYGYGGRIDEDFTCLDSVGYAIYDLYKNELIVNEIVDYKFYRALPYNYNNLIRINCKTLESRTYIVYDFENQKVYKKSYPLNQIGLMKEVTEQGFVFEENFKGSGLFRIDYFDQVFKEEGLK